MTFKLLYFVTKQAGKNLVETTLYSLTKKRKKWTAIVHSIHFHSCFWSIRSMHFECGTFFFIDCLRSLLSASIDGTFTCFYMKTAFKKNPYDKFHYTFFYQIAHDCFFFAVTQIYSMSLNE